MELASMDLGSLVRVRAAAVAATAAGSGAGLPLGLAWQWAGDVLAGLAHLHERGVAHMDVTRCGGVRSSA